ncbi:MAG TPA: hypothetical protein VMF69_24050 [Gemmataceae bacterium]|nr:hypothetical protein [Gemmataceae bacterium]
MPKIDPVAELAQKLLTTLEQQRQSVGEYPLTVARLAALADPQATAEQTAKALAKKPFVERWLIANKKDRNSPIALAEDGERLAESPLLLEFALGQLCSADKPLHTPTKAVNKVVQSLRPAFKRALERQIADNALPPAVGVMTVRGKPQLFLHRFPPPPPPPPKKKPAEELSEKLVQVLIQERERGADVYPAELNRLIEQTGMATTPTVRKQALRSEPFRSQALLALPRLPNSPVALTGDRERLMISPRFLYLTLSAVRTPDNQAVAVADLAKKLSKDLQGDFREAVNRKVSERNLPDELGVLFIKKKPLLFLRADIDTGTGVEKSMLAPRPSPLAPPAVDFAALFDEAFRRLDRQHGGHNHVSLVELRQAMPVERAAFDAGLQQLRRAGRYSLSAAEGRHGLDPAERDAAIHEDGSLLLFVSRRSEG